IEHFAKLTGRSLAGFKRDFQKTFDTSPRQWLQRKRLEEAYYQIEKYHKKPSAIYLDLGFESLAHFSDSFKKVFGVLPSKLHQNEYGKKSDSIIGKEEKMGPLFLRLTIVNLSIYSYEANRRKHKIYKQS